MIILDEQLKRRSIVRAIAQWYPGAVVDILTLRPNSIIKDDNIVTLLHAAQRPIFVTINVDDFWRKVPAHPAYCMIAIDNNPDLKTRSARLGKIIHVQKSGIRFYSQNGRIQTIPI
ncbi:MAG: hypothetical protein R3A44_30140 [Caldilineaceae bacterium]